MSGGKAPSQDPASIRVPIVADAVVPGSLGATAPEDETGENEYGHCAHAPHDPSQTSSLDRHMISTWLRDPYRILRENSALSRLLAGQGLSSLADWLLAVILTVLVFDISHSGTAVSLLTFTRLAPYALVLPWSGILLDRIDKRLLMAGLGSGRALCMLGLLVVRSPETLPLIFPLVFLSSSLSCLLRPTVNATIPALVTDEDAISANGLVSQLDGAAHVAGPALAAAFVLFDSPQLALLVTAAAFSLSSVSFYTARIPARALSSDSTADLSPAEAMAGFRYLLRENEGVLVALAAAAAGLALLLGAYYVLAVELCTRTFHLGGQGVGWLDAVYGLGGLTGSLLVGGIASGRRLVHVFVAGAALSAVGVLLLAISPSGPLPFACMAVVGLAGAMVQVTGTTILQAAAPREMLGRTFTAFEATLVAAMLIGALTAGPLVRIAGPRGGTAVFALAGCLLLAGALPRLRSLQSVLGVRVFLRSVPILRAVSRELLDELAPRFETVTFSADTQIVREGDPGDRLYIVGQGEVVVSVGGKAVRQLGPGSYFGEVALLHDVPRTASVRARTTTLLFSLDRDTFKDLTRGSRDITQTLAREGERTYVYSSPMPRF